MSAKWRTWGDCALDGGGRPTSSARMASRLLELFLSPPSTGEKGAAHCVHPLPDGEPLDNQGTALDTMGDS